MERYTAMYPCGQLGLPDNLVTAYVNGLQATHITSSAAAAWRAQSTRPRDLTRECFVCVASTSSSSTDPEPAPHHCATDAQRMVRLNELAEARLQLDEELSNLHREFGEHHEPLNRQPALLPAPAVGPGVGVAL
jgi:hypothetical protein